ncbi:cytochrome c oxidase assembly protein [Kolteria novifilia]|uniref:cytochrome c oxidase assembly protein n=1 Tax=Kolteria novifilia TaxID=2527975 RepID=UPI003AF36A49
MPSPEIVLPALLCSWIYLRGWYWLRRRLPQRFGWDRLAYFHGGLATFLLSLISPLEPLAGVLLSVHMVQHLLLMMATPLLIWLGWPLVPMLKGLPTAIRRGWIVPILRLPLVLLLSRWLTRPVPALALYIGVTWLWHIPRLYDLALRDPDWHRIEHGLFLFAGFVFWYLVVAPYPFRRTFPRWLLIPYLFAASIQNTILAATLCYADEPLYRTYAQAPRLFASTVIEDQATAGAIMWVCGSMMYLLPLVVILPSLFASASPSRRSQPSPRPVTLSVLSQGQVDADRGRARADLFHLPLVGPWLRWRHGRRLLQATMLLVAALVIWDGLVGPQVAPINLAGILPWIHWRGFVVLGLLVVGNVFCMACPFMLPRDLAKRWLPANRHWPRRLRTKWLAAGLLLLFFWAYETFALWSAPWATAWITLGYFTAAILIDGIFRGASFCKYVCPIGQFHFIQSLLSPFEVAVRNVDICSACATKDCIRGNENQRGCELALFQPRKVGNADCTFCLDCVHACPHDNVGLLAVTPSADLWDDRRRSGVGRFSQRTDLAALVLVLVFGAFVNAALMTAPVATRLERTGMMLGSQGPMLATTAAILLAVVVIPLLGVTLAAVGSRILSGDRGRSLQIATRYSFALVPMGAAMWLSHYLFHFVVGFWGLWPALQRFALDIGIRGLGTPVWPEGCSATVVEWMLRAQIVALDIGLVVSLYTAYRIARTRVEGLGRIGAAVLPWACLMVALFASGVAILLQPMEMRGTGF